MTGDVRIDVAPPLRETKKGESEKGAWLFQSTKGPRWIPKSQGHLVRETRRGREQLVLIVAGWLDEREHLSDILQ